MTPHMLQNLFRLWPLLALLCLWACGSEPTQTPVSLQTGTWHAEVYTQGQAIPFLVEVAQPTDSTVQFTLRNGEERIALDPAPLRGDSLHVPIDIFDASLELKADGGVLVGHWVKHYAEGYRVPVRLTAGKEARFQTTGPPATDYSGRYAVTFTVPDEGGRTYPAIGVFEQVGNVVTGTFLTKTGDYRYLAGVADGDSLRLSTFNGEWAYLFTAGKTTEGTLAGEFWSGKTGYKTWTATPDSTASLPNATTLTYLKPGYGPFRFQFPGTDGDTVSYPSEAFLGKPTVVQIFGTWCPNCRDETRFLADWYRRNKDRGVEIIGLAFERNPDPTYAGARIEKMREKLDVGYRFAIAGESNTESASQALPMLSQVLSFPTTIYLDKYGRVRKIHTGFSGPGTGEAYEAFVADFTATMEQLLAE